MSADSLLRERKSALRREAYARRLAQPKKDEASRRILERLMDLAEFQQANTILVYVHTRSEVRTRPALPRFLETGKRVAVPFCAGDQLQLFQLESPEELAPGVFGVLEPAPILRGEADRLLPVREVDLIITPGVAFDLQGGRLGYGRGYYDRLLARRRAETTAAALAYETQIFPLVPRHEGDLRVELIVTENAVHRCVPRRGGEAENRNSRQAAPDVRE